MAPWKHDSSMIDISAKSSGWVFAIGFLGELVETAYA
jgi:hypothetical protein